MRGSLLVLTFILWTYHPAPWTFASMNMTAGWFSLVTLDDLETCKRAKEPMLKWSGAIITDTKCLPAGVEPFPISRMIRK